MASGRCDWNYEVHRKPAAVTVAKLYLSHGVHACIERWGWMHPRTISALIFDGKQQLESERATR